MIDSLFDIHLANYKAEKILDVGPGYNHFSRHAAKIVGAQSISYIDCNADVLHWQQNECKKIGFKSNSFLMSLTPDSIKSIDETYQLVLCQEVFEHLVNAEEILASLVEKMSPKAKLIVTVPTKLSEIWLKKLNPTYMRNEPFGHVRQFNENELISLLQSANLSPIIVVGTQPHYFVSHMWLYGTRMKVTGSTGQVITKDIRALIFNKLTAYSKSFFLITGANWWGKRFPRNYFAIASRNF